MLPTKSGKNELLWDTDGGMVQIRVVPSLFRRADDLFFVPSDWRNKRRGSWTGLPLSADFCIREPGLGRRPRSCMVSEEV